MSVQAVWFDLDDTLLWDERSVEETFRYVCEAAQRRTGVEPEALEAAVRKAARELYESYETFAFTQMIGINPFEGLWGNFDDGDHPMFARLRELAPVYRRDAWTRGLAALGIEDAGLGRELGELFHDERRRRPLVYEETFAILDELKGKYKLLLLTNGSPDLQREKLAGVPRLAPYFDQIMISGTFGKGKPAPEIFEHCLRLMNMEASQGIMVGDKLTTDILGANRIGMPSVWVNRRGRQPAADIRPAFEIRDLMEIPGVIRTIESEA